MTPLGQLRGQGQDPDHDLDLDQDQHLNQGDIEDLAGIAGMQSKSEVDQAVSEQQKRIPVMEIFGPTIQGEGPVIGHQTLFVRFGGCDYRCRMCDSMHAVIPELIHKGATWLTEEQLIEAVMETVIKTRCGTVTLSGGNPVIHDLSLFVSVLKKYGVRLVLETQGTMYRPWVTQCNTVVVSPKTPGMGEKFEPVKLIAFLKSIDHLRDLSIKVVVFSFSDVEFALNIFQTVKSVGIYGVKKYLSLGNPMPPSEPGGVEHETFSTTELLKNYRVLMEDILSDPRTRDIIVLPQLHVLLWGNKREV